MSTSVALFRGFPPVRLRILYTRGFSASSTPKFLGNLRYWPDSPRAKQRIPSVLPNNSSTTIRGIECGAVVWVDNLTQADFVASLADYTNIEC